MSEILEKRKLAEASGRPYGRLIIKEYPPATMNANQLLALAKDLDIKRNGFKPDFIMVDYLGLMIPNGKAFSDNTYGKLKTVAEELRAVAVKLNVPILSAVQVNRSGYEESEIGLEKTSDSMGIPMTADVMIMVSRTEDLAANNQLYYHVAKSRFSKNGSGFLVSVDYDFIESSGNERKQKANQSTDKSNGKQNNSQTEPSSDNVLDDFDDKE
jgi:replicative DNA helicase